MTHSKMNIIRNYVLALCVGVAFLPSEALVRKDDREDPARGAPAMKKGAQPQSQKRENRAVPERQAKALKQAEAEGVGVVWGDQMQGPLSVRARDLGEPRILGGKGLRVRKGAPWKDNAIAVMDGLAPLFDIEDAEEEFDASRVDTDKLGFHHVRLEQRHKGLRVVGGDLIVHFNRDDAAYEVNGQYAPGIKVGIRPGVAAAAAAKAARDDLLEMGLAEVKDVKAPERVVYALDGAEPRLAWELSLSGKAPGQTVPGEWRYWIDAQTGGVLMKYDDVKRISPPVNALGTPAMVSGSVLEREGGASVQVEGWLQNGAYYLYNTNFAWMVYNRSESPALYPDANTYAFRMTGNWGISDRAEISAACNIDVTQRYYREVHGRRSYDTSNTVVRVNAHFDNVDNAYWEGGDVKQIHIGDGAARSSCLAVLDVMAHEFTHAVTEFSAGLRYLNESGALNESFSDIFGACVEFYAQADNRGDYPLTQPGTADWYIGEDCWLYDNRGNSVVGLRNMREPRSTAVSTPQPSRYQGALWEGGAGDNGGVHQNSGPHNFLFYLVCDGGFGINDGYPYAVDGIGIQDAEQIAYRVLTVYCTPNSNYAAVREAWYSATRDLFPGDAARLASVRNAWAAIMGQQPRPIIRTEDPLPDGRLGNDYTLSFSVSSPSPAFEWLYVGGSLPPDLVVTPNGRLSGPCLQSGTYTFSIAVEANNGLVSLTNEFTVYIRPPLEAPLGDDFDDPDRAGPLTGWSQEYISGGLGWRVRQGGPCQSKPPAGVAGPKNAYLGRWDDYGSAIATHSARLVSPLVVFGPEARAAQLRFWLCMEQWSYQNLQDELRVYCKTNKLDAWGEPIATFTASVPWWEQKLIDLPFEAANQQVWIAFEGRALGGYGVCLDGIWVGDPIPPLAITTPSVLPVALVETNYVELAVLTSEGGWPAEDPVYTYRVVGGTMPDGFGLTPEGVVTGRCMTVQSGAFMVEVSSGTKTATKEFVLIVELPRAPVLSADFDSGVLPPGWTFEWMGGTSHGITWLIKDGGGWNGSSPPYEAHSPTKYAFLYGTPGVNDQMIVRLITPVIDLSQVPANTRLTFWHFMQQRSGIQDSLGVWYRNTPNGAWTLLEYYNDNVTNWTQRAVQLPNLTHTYQIAFQGRANGGYGVCVDTIRITDDAAAPIITTVPQLPGSFRGFPYSTTLAAVGGLQPYTWSLVSGSLPSSLTLDTATGEISGTPDTAGDFPFRIAVTGVDGRASTNNFTLRILPPGRIPFTEAFNGPGLPAGWSVERVDGYVDWVTSRGTICPYVGAIPAVPPANVVSNACLWTANSGVTTARLVSPPLNLSSLVSNATMTFQLCMAECLAGRDKVKVRYRTSPTDNWTDVTEIVYPLKKWTPQTITLPNVSSTYYIAFEGYARGGYGICIADLVIFGDIFESPFDTWRKEHFPDALDNPDISGPDADPDGDGIPNLMEYAMGLDPNVYNINAWVYGGITNLVNYTGVNTGSYFYLKYRRANEVQGVKFSVLGTPSLVPPELNWQTNNILPLVPWQIGTEPEWSWVYNIHLTPTTNAPARFMKLRVELDP